MAIQPLSTRLIKPNFCFDLSHRRSTTVSLETRNSLPHFFPHTDYTIILFVLFYAFPLTVISFLYSLFIFKNWRRRVPGNRSTVTTEAYSRSRRKALKVFISIVVCFALCWLPYRVTFFLSSYNKIYFNCDLPRDIAFTAVFFFIRHQCIQSMHILDIEQRISHG